MRRFFRRYSRGIEDAKAKRKAQMAGLMIADSLRTKIISRYVIEKGKRDFVALHSSLGSATYALR